MRILYGAFAQGHGHFSKASALVPLLERRGHEVRVVSSGWDQPPSGYRFTWHRHFPGMSYEVVDGRTDFVKTFTKWLREMPQLFRHLIELRNLVREFAPQLIISDFEPLSASPFLEAKCEVVALSRQVALFDRQVELPGEMGFERRMTRSVIRMFTAGADRMFGYHYEPASFRCVPPIIRSDLFELTPQNGDHILVYNHYHITDGGSPEELINWAKSRNQPVKIYGLPQVERGRIGNVEFLPPSSKQMLVDMSTAKAVATTAGLTTPVEAFLLGKPAITIPIPNQWEQLVNAFHLDQCGIAAWSRTWDYDRLLNLEPPGATHPLGEWLRTPPDRILDHVLSETAPMAVPAPRLAIVA